jgi:hypothetical protein
MDRKERAVSSDTLQIAIECLEAYKQVLEGKNVPLRITEDGSSLMPHRVIFACRGKYVVMTIEVLTELEELYKAMNFMTVMGHSTE